MATKRIVIFFTSFTLLCFLSLITNAQDLTPLIVSGVVTDSSGKPVADASISLIERNTESAFVFSKTDHGGNFSLVVAEFIDKRFLAIRVNAIGYDKLILPVNDLSKKITIILHPVVRKLPDVTVIYVEPAVKIKGDTLSYLASAFSGKNDRVLGDILRKIPGLEIDEYHTIRYLGKPINHLYIDGDDLFDSKYQAATSVIPSGIINRVEIIPDNQDIKMLSGIVPAYSPGINITTGDKHRMNIINSVQLTVGCPSVLNGSLNNLSFKPKLKFMNLIKSNNTGTDIVSASGITDANDLPPVPGNTGVSSLLSVPVAGIPSIEKKRYFNNYSAALNINDFIKGKNELAWKINAYFITEKQNQQFDNQTAYILPPDTVYFRQAWHSHIDRKLWRVSITTSLNTRLKFLTNILSVDRAMVSGDATIDPGYTKLNQSINNMPVRYSNNFTAIKLLRKKAFVEMSSFVNYEKKPQLLYTSPGIQKEILTGGIDYLSSRQSIDLPVFFTNHFISYKINGKGVFQSYKAGLVTQHANLTSLISVTPVNGPDRSLDSAFTNDLTWQKIKLFIEANMIIRKKNTVFNITFPFSKNLISYTNMPGIPVNLNKFIFTPELRLDYQLGSESALYAGYRYFKNLGNMNELYTGIVMKDFQTFSSNQLSLQETEARTVIAGLDLKRPLKLWSAGFSSMYSERFSPFIHSTLLTNKVMKTIAVQMDNRIYSSTFSMSFSKNIPAVKTSFAAGYSIRYNRYYALQNNFLFPITSLGHYMFTRIAIKPTEFASLNISSKQSWLIAKQQLYNIKSENSTKSTQSSYTMEALLSPAKKISFRVNGEQVQSWGYGIASSAIFFADAAARYQFERSNLAVDLSVKNVFNERDYIEIYSFDNTNAVNHYQLRPRMILLSVSMSF